METTTTNSKKPSINSLFFQLATLFLLIFLEHYVWTIAIADSFLTSSVAGHRKRDSCSLSLSGLSHAA